MNNLINIECYKYYSQLYRLILPQKHKEWVFFCAGNYKIWFDCFASAVGERLRKENIRCFVYGGKDFPILPDNLSEFVDFVQNKHPNALVIVVDNLLTYNQEECGQVVIHNRSTNIAGAITNVCFGDISVLLKTYPRQHCYLFLQQQNLIVNNLISAINLINKNIKNA